jgi:DNA-directed RNA polymerase subunit N (RpoN/RPB10)
LAETNPLNKKTLRKLKKFGQQRDDCGLSQYCSRRGNTADVINAIGQIAKAIKMTKIAEETG